MNRNAIIAAAAFAVSAMYVAPVVATQVTHTPEPDVVGTTTPDVVRVSFKVGQDFRVNLPASSSPKRAAKVGTFRVVDITADNVVRFDQVSADGSRIVRGKGFRLTTDEQVATRDQVVAVPAATLAAAA